MVAEVGAGAAFFYIIIIVAVVSIVLSFILHDSYHRVRFWNFTKYKVLWTMWFYEGKLTSGPVEVNRDDSVKTYIPFAHVCNGSPIKDTQPLPQAHYGDLYVVSDSQWHGLGYALQLKLVGSSNDNDVKYTGTLMFDIPYTGKTSTSVTFDTITDLGKYYRFQEGQHKEVTQTAKSTDGIISLTTSYDFLEGKHPIPGQGDKTGFYYQSLIVLEESGLTADSLPKCSAPKAQPPKGGSSQ